MQYMDDLEEQIDKLVQNTMGINVNKNFSRGILSAEIILPKEKLPKEINVMEFFVVNAPKEMMEY